MRREGPRSGQDVGMPSAVDGLLDAKQAATYLNVSRASIAWLCRTKQLAYAVVCGKRRFRKRDLDAYVGNHLVKAIP